MSMASCKSIALISSVVASSVIASHSSRSWISGVEGGGLSAPTAVAVVVKVRSSEGPFFAQVR